MGYYTTAQICLNGHTITTSAGTHPEFDSKFCDECGAATIMECQQCRTKIRGYYHTPGLSIPLGLGYVPPKFCHNCGKPYPWTDAKLAAAKEFTSEIEGLDAEEREILSKSIEDLVKDSPNIEVAALRFKKLVAKAGKSAAEGFKNILINLVSEAAKKLLWPQN